MHYAKIKVLIVILRPVFLLFAFQKVMENGRPGFKRYLCFFILFLFKINFKAINATVIFEFTVWVKLHIYLFLVYTFLIMFVFTVDLKK